MTTNDGGQAFPYGDHDHGGASGMTLRDWFAGQALAGISSVHTELGPFGSEDEFKSLVKDAIQRNAEAAYWYADAMLEARGA